MDHETYQRRMRNLDQQMNLARTPERRREITKEKEETGEARREGMKREGKRTIW